MKVVNLKDVFYAGVTEEEIFVECQNPSDIELATGRGQEHVMVRHTTYGELRFYLLEKGVTKFVVIFAHGGVWHRQFRGEEEYYFDGQGWRPCHRKSLFPGGKIEPQEGEFCIR
ncbi:MAG: hypothetical protein AAB360_03110 [Patescibacteria group bacterium]